MSNVSFSSSASQREGCCYPRSFSQFIGLEDLASVDDVDYVTSMLPHVYSKGAFAAYHAYLRKFDAGSSAGSIVSASTSASVASGSGRRVEGFLPKVAKVEVPSVSVPKVSANDDGYCFLRAVKEQFWGAAAQAVGAHPSFYQLMALPLDMFDLDGQARVSVVAPDRCHVSVDGSHCFFEAMKQVAARFITVSVPGSAWNHFRALCDIGSMGIFSPVMVVGGSQPTTTVLDMVPGGFLDVPLSGFAQALWMADVPEGSTYNLQFAVPGLVCRGDMLLYTDDYRTCAVNGVRVSGVCCVKPGDVVDVTVESRKKLRDVKFEVDVVPVGLGEFLAKEMTLAPHKGKYFRDVVTMGCRGAGERKWFDLAVGRVISSVLAGVTIHDGVGDYSVLMDYPSVRAMDNCTLPAWVQFLSAGWFVGRDDDEVHEEMLGLRAALFPLDPERKLAVNDLWLRYGGSEAAFLSGPARH